MGDTTREKAEAQIAAVHKGGKSDHDGPVSSPTEATARTARLQGLRLAKEKAEKTPADAPTLRRLPQALVHG